MSNVRKGEKKSNGKVSANGVAHMQASFNNTTDTITELANEGIDTIQSSVAFNLAGNAMWANIENLTITATTAGHALVSIAAAHDILIWNAAGVIGTDDFLFA